MTAEIHDIVVIGAGPAGASALHALADMGRHALLLDAGIGKPAMPPSGGYLDLRREDPEQWRWLLGNAGAMDAAGAASPKLRVPGLAPLFHGYADANRLRTEGFHLVGALAAGGLSNAWGCGVARFDASELGALVGVADELDASYRIVAKRIGLSGANDDALRDYFGVDAYADPPLPLEPVSASLWRRMIERPSSSAGFEMGRARLAVLSLARDGRPPCDGRGMCLWGCEQGSTWSASREIDALGRLPTVKYESGVLVTALERNADGWDIRGLRDGVASTWRARRILLGAGTVASTRLALNALPTPPGSVRMLSNPMAAFLLMQPQLLGRAHVRGNGLAQLSYRLANAAGSESACGNLFPTAGLPVAEFLEHLPMSRRAGLPFLRVLLPAVLVGNVFLPGSLSRHEVLPQSDGGLLIRGGQAPELDAVHAEVVGRLRRAFRRVGGLLLPGSYKPAITGADIHYVGTLPISRSPAAHECRLNGEIAGLPGVHAIDGAALPHLPAKAHTLTIMANADRVARALSA